MPSAAFEVAYAEVGLLEKAPGQEEQLEVLYFLLSGILSREKRENTLIADT
jgi:hypothetical protein